MIQIFIVAIIVTIAAVYAINHYAPKKLVRKLGAWVSIGVGAIGFVQFSKRIAKTWTFESPSGSSCGNACGRCGGCGSSGAAQFETAALENNSLQKYPVIAMRHKN